MRLQPPECLSTSTLSSQDVGDVAKISHSTLLTSPIARLRHEGIPTEAGLQWLLSIHTAKLPRDLDKPRISKLFKEDRNADALPTETASEHIAIRDPDLSKPGTSHPCDTGTIVSYASYIYHPNGPPAPAPGHSPPSGSSNAPPPGYHKTFSDYWTARVESTLHTTFAPLPCFELHSIATLTPSHLRKGTAKQLVEWIFPYADRRGLPVVLAASAMGVKLYEKCGFVEVGTLEVDLGVWGWKGAEQERGHVHRIMVRWPEGEAELVGGWREWRAERGL